MENPRKERHRFWLGLRYSDSDFKCKNISFNENKLDGVDLNCNGVDQGWVSDMEIDGPTFVPKSGYFLLSWVKVCPQTLAFS